MLIICGLVGHNKSTSVLPTIQVHVPQGTLLPSDLVCGNKNTCLLAMLWMMCFLCPVLFENFSAFVKLQTHPLHVSVQSHLLLSNM